MPYVKEEDRKYPYKPKFKIKKNWRDTPMSEVEAKLEKTIKDCNEKIQNCPKCTVCGYICHFEFGKGYSQFCAETKCDDLAHRSRAEAAGQDHITSELRELMNEGIRRYHAERKQRRGEQ